MNVLFVCSRNQWRSPTAEAIYANDSRVTARSGGTASSARRKLGRSDIEWAEVVVVMETKHKRVIHERFRDSLDELPRIVVLDIPDDYRAMDSELVELLRESESLWM